MIYCSNCGKSIPDDSKFCTYCGTAILAANPQESTPANAAPVQSQSAAPVKQNTFDTKNAFYSNPGFWGALLLLAGFFLPFYHELVDNTDYSLSQMASNGGSSAGVYLFYLYPVAAMVLIIQGLVYIFPPVVANILKILPLLLLVFCFGALAREGNTNNSLSAFFISGRIGMYAILLGSIMVLFFRRKV